MKIKRIEHVAIAVNDLENMTAVLRDVLGLKPDYIENLSKARVALFPLGDSAIELVQGVGPEAQSAKWSPREARAFITYVLRSKISIAPWTNFVARASNS